MTADSGSPVERICGCGHIGLRDGRHFRPGDRVLMVGERYRDGHGTVIRVARDGSWVDLLWRQPHGARWSKRHPAPSRITHA